MVSYILVWILELSVYRPTRVSESPYFTLHHSKSSSEEYVIYHSMLIIFSKSMFNT